MIEYLTRVGAWISQGVNCIVLFGNEDMTVSARCYVKRDRRAWGFAYRAINVVFFWQDDHCQGSFLRDVMHAKQVIGFHDSEYK